MFVSPDAFSPVKTCCYDSKQNWPDIRGGSSIAKLRGISMVGVAHSLANWKDSRMLLLGGETEDATLVRRETKW